MVLVVVENYLGYTKGLTVSLQSRSMDICTAYREANTVRTVLTEIRDNIDQHHKAWYETAVELSEKIHGSAPSIPRRCSRQTQRANVPAETPEEFYRRSLTVSFIDHMISHIDTRFSNLLQWPSPLSHLFFCEVARLARQSRVL